MAGERHGRLIAAAFVIGGPRARGPPGRRGRRGDRGDAVGAPGRRSPRRRPPSARRRPLRRARRHGRALREPAVYTSHHGVLNVTLVTSEKRVTIAGPPGAGQGLQRLVHRADAVASPGDLVRVKLVDHLDQPTNLHFHGLEVSPSGDADNIFVSVDARPLVPVPVPPAAQRRHRDLLVPLARDGPDVGDGALPHHRVRGAGVRRALGAARGQGPDPRPAAASARDPAALSGPARRAGGRRRDRRHRHQLQRPRRPGWSTASSGRDDDRPRARPSCGTSATSAPTSSIGSRCPGTRSRWWPRTAIRSSTPAGCPRCCCRRASAGTCLVRGGRRGTTPLQDALLPRGRRQLPGDDAGHAGHHRVARCARQRRRASSPGRRSTCAAPAWPAGGLSSSPRTRRGRVFFIDGQVLRPVQDQLPRQAGHRRAVDDRQPHRGDAPVPHAHLSDAARSRSTACRPRSTATRTRSCSGPRLRGDAGQLLRFHRARPSSTATSSPTRTRG